ncbi:ligand-binding sensor domain-containing protein [Algivirga pacifica]|uniref:HTH luxR-type domain-containing protein n=1 Tax=Algivirga pacifica TaxID=1162670 RepID=A0ABP9CZR3_9BACT
MLLKQSFLVGILSILTSFTYAQYAQLKKLTATDGLSQNDIYCIAQDYQGFIWLGTDDGLNRYDGYEMETYKKGSEPGTLSFNAVRVLLEDSKKRLWIGTHAGLNRYNREKDTFVVYNNFEDSLQHDIRAIMEDQQGAVWVGTVSGGLFYYEEESDTFQSVTEVFQGNAIQALSIGNNGEVWVGTSAGIYQYKNGEAKLIGLPELEVRSLQMDGDKLWIGTYLNGLYQYDMKHKKLQKKLVEVIGGRGSVLSLMIDRSGLLWIGMEQEGVFIWNRKQKRQERLGFSSSRMDTKALLSLMEDREGNIWIGAFASGAFIYNPQERFQLLTQECFHSSTISGKNITALYESKNDDWWIGTDGEGLDRFRPDMMSFTNYRFSSSDPNTLGSNNILSLDEDAQGNIWVGTYGGGLAHLEVATGKITRYQYAAGNTNSIVDDNVWEVLVDQEGKVWAGTDKGISVFDPKNKYFEHYTADDREGTLSNGEIRSIYEDVRGDIWIGTFYGLNRFDRKTKRFEVYHLPIFNNNTSKGILCITEDNALNLWVGTFGGGVFRFNRTTRKFESFSDEEGLPNNMVYSIVEDDAHHLWMGTGRGVMDFNPMTMEHSAFTEEDGLQSGRFNRNAAVKLKDGRLLFGGVEGVNIIDPSDEPQGNVTPEVQLTKLKVFNQEVGIGGEETTLPRQLTQMEKIVLKPEEKAFSITYSAMNYLYNDKMRYAYRLKGFDKQWNYVGNQRTASYTNLAPGTYTLEVKATIDTRNWPDKVKTIRVVVEPFFWQTPWFAGLVIGIVIITLFSFYRWKLGVERRQQQRLNRLVKQRTEELEEEKRKAIRKGKLLLAAEQENRELVQSQLEEQLSFREKELMTHTLHTIHKNELLKRLRDALKQMERKQETARSALKGLIGQIDDSFQLDKDWEQFNVLFSEVHKNFIKALKTQFPDLTETNLRLCYLYRMQLSSKDIAVTLGISINSVKVARHRLRKKLGLSQDESLRQFLQELSAEEVYE